MRRKVQKFVLAVLAAGVAAGFGGAAFMSSGTHSFQARGHQYLPPKPPAHHR